MTRALVAMLFAWMLTGCVAMIAPQPVFNGGPPIAQAPLHTSASWWKQPTQTSFFPPGPFGEPLTREAIEITRSDRATYLAMKEAGGVGLGGLTVTPRPTRRRGGPTMAEYTAHLHDEASHAAAAQGGTHFILVDLGNENTYRSDAYYVYDVYRLEPAGWPELEFKFRPVVVTSAP